MTDRTIPVLPAMPDKFIFRGEPCVLRSLAVKQAGLLRARAGTAVAVAPHEGKWVAVRYEEAKP